MGILLNKGGMVGFNGVYCMAYAAITAASAASSLLTVTAIGEGGFSRYVFFVFEDRSVLEEAVTTAFREVYKATRVFLEEKSRKTHRVEFRVKYEVSGKVKTDGKFKIYDYGRYYVIASIDLGLPTADPDSHLIAYIISRYVRKSKQSSVE